MRLPEYPALRRARSSRTRARRMFIAIVVGSGALLSPCALRAQAPGLFETFASRKESTSDPLFGGISLAGFNGPFGLRLSGALNAAADSSSDGSQSGVVCDRFRCR